jgi:hypothetical protein
VKHETIFPIIGFFAHEILGVVRPQIEIEWIFFLVGTLINLRNCCLQLDNFKKLIFANKK